MGKSPPRNPLWWIGSVSSSWRVRAVNSVSACITLTPGFSRPTPKCENAPVRVCHSGSCKTDDAIMKGAQRSGDRVASNPLNSAGATPTTVRLTPLTVSVFPTICGSPASASLPECLADNRNRVRARLSILLGIESTPESHVDPAHSEEIARDKLTLNWLPDSFAIPADERGFWVKRS